MPVNQRFSRTARQFHMGYSSGEIPGGCVPARNRYLSFRIDISVQPGSGILYYGTLLCEFSLWCDRIRQCECQFSRGIIVHFCTVSLQSEQESVMKRRIVIRFDGLKVQRGSGNSDRIYTGTYRGTGLCSCRPSGSCVYDQQTGGQQCEAQFA
ncbi:hypothetical protein D3C80_1665590 [compost metagenome]